MAIQPWGFYTAQVRWRSREGRSAGPTTAKGSYVKWWLRARARLVCADEPGCSHHLNDRPRRIGWTMDSQRSVARHRIAVGRDRRPGLPDPHRAQSRAIIGDSSSVGLADTGDSFQPDRMDFRTGLAPSD